MSTQGSSLAARRKKKQLTILAVMVGVTGITWSRTLFGGSESPTPTPTAPPAGIAAGAASGTPAASRGPVAAVRNSSIGSFEQAMARMQVWPKALDRQIHTGPIEEIVPFEDLTAEKEEILEPVIEAPSFPPIDPSPLVETTPEEPEQPDIAFEDLGLELTTTAIMGKNRYAVIEGERWMEGDTLEIQVDGQTIRYEISAILPRSVELREGETKYILRIATPGFQSRGNGGA